MKRSRHHQSSVRKTGSNSVIHISVRPWNTASSSSITNKSLDRHKNLHRLSTDLNLRYHRDELQNRSNTQSQPSKSQILSINTISEKFYRHSRSLSPSNENTYKRNYRNKVSPQEDKFSAELVNDQRRQHQTTILNRYETSDASSERKGIIEDHHRNPNRKKKQTCSRFSLVISISVGVLVGIVVITLLTIFLIKSKTKQGNIPTGTNYTLRWSKAGDTIAGVVGQNGTASNQLYRPFGLAIDAYNTLYIADCNNNRVQRWLAGASTGTTVSGQTNGTSVTSSNSLLYPAGVLVDSNSNIYVADSGNSRIQYWSAGSTSGTTIAGNGTVGAANGQLNNAYGIALDTSSSTLYVADYGNHRMMSYASGTSLGNMVSGIGVSGPNITQLSSPTSVYFDSPSNSLIIVNFGTDNVVRWPLGASSWTLVAGSNVGVFGNTSTLLTHPVGMTMDPMGNVYIADMLNHRIQLFLVGQLDGITIAGVTSVSGANSSLLYKPFWVVLDNQLNLYVADTYNNRIQRFLRY